MRCIESKHASPSSSSCMFSTDFQWNEIRCQKNAVLQNFEIRRKFSRRSRSTQLCRWSCKLKNLNFWRQEVRPLNSWVGSHCCYPQQTTRFISPIYSVHFDSSWPSIRCHWLAAKCHDLVPPPPPTPTREIISLIRRSAESGDSLDWCIFCWPPMTAK